jgi:hypothetical protein
MESQPLAIASFGWAANFGRYRCGADSGKPSAGKFMGSRPRTRAFSSEADTGSREENVPKQESGASVLIQSEPIMRWHETPLPEFAQNRLAIPG